LLLPDESTVAVPTPSSSFHHPTKLGVEATPDGIGARDSNQTAQSSQKKKYIVLFILNPPSRNRMGRNQAAPVYRHWLTRQSRICAVITSLQPESKWSAKGRVADCEQHGCTGSFQSAFYAYANGTNGSTIRWRLASPARSSPRAPYRPPR